MVENNAISQRKLAIEVGKNVLFTSGDVLIGSFMSAAGGLTFGPPVGVLLGLPGFRQGAKDLHSAAIALKKYRDQAKT
ncbi:MAG TPA: hypothetical protein VKC53_03000 [Patescibacteria group bacterium]|nr:hypothetical protein [Patescibacteria group bacterium]